MVKVNSYLNELLKMCISIGVRQCHFPKHLGTVNSEVDLME